MSEQYEGFSNYTTWFVCMVVDNHREMYLKMMEGLRVVTRRFKGGDPVRNSYPFITCTHGGFGSISLLDCLVPQLRDEAGKPPYAKRVLANMGVTMHLTFAYDVVDWAFSVMGAEMDDESLDRSEIVIKEVCEHLVTTHLETLWQEQQYCWEPEREDV